MTIDKNFLGGNIEVLSVDGDTVFVERELRDTEGDWFYWAFCVRGAAGKTLTFRFPKNMPRVGYWGAAFSHDLTSWAWTGNYDSTDGDAFTYSFGKDENEVYFAHDCIYPHGRMYALFDEFGVKKETLALSKKGREIPCFSFGCGEKKITLTSRHHACENTGTYVLEGVVRSLLENPIDGYSFFCVPFVDYDGVVDGDQGKGRIPHDHNRDYAHEQEPIYSSCAAIRKFFDENHIACAFDFHSPWHTSGENDKVYIVYGMHEQLPNLQRFGKLFEESITPDSLQYQTANDHLPDTGWNRSDSPTCTRYPAKKPETLVTFSLETPYFGERGNEVTEEKMVALGKCFADALRKFLA